MPEPCETVGWRQQRLRLFLSYLSGLDTAVLGTHPICSRLAGPVASFVPPGLAAVGTCRITAETRAVASPVKKRRQAPQLKRGARGTDLAVMSRSGQQPGRRPTLRKTAPKVSTAGGQSTIPLRGGTS